MSETEGLASTVASHYNNLQEAGLKERGKSRIFFQRNYCNWIKSMAIGEALDKIRSENHGQPISVLDLCSGKGGDLLKWKKGSIDSLVCADIAGTSVEQCEVRYKDMVGRSRNERRPEKMFSAEFITADCTKCRLRDIYKDPSTKFDLVSCQFSFHYSFESLPQAEMMLANACESLRPGGYFIGTTPNSCELVRRLRASDDLSFGNEVYRITFEEGTDKNDLALFGAKYNFDLDDSVHCPEFLVYFPLLEKLAEKHGMKLIYRIPFSDFFQKHIQSSEGLSLANRMQAFEPYSTDEGADLVCKDPEGYAHAREFIRKKAEEQQQQPDDRYRSNRDRGSTKVGTLSQPEWDASTLYLAFMFQRRV